MNTKIKFNASSLIPLIPTPGVIFFRLFGFLAAGGRISCSIFEGITKTKSRSSKIPLGCATIWGGGVGRKMGCGYLPCSLDTVLAESSQLRGNYSTCSSAFFLKHCFLRLFCIFHVSNYCLIFCSFLCQISTAYLNKK